MRKGQQQIRCSSGVSIADRIDSLLQTRGLPPQKMRHPKGRQQGQGPEMGMSGEDGAAPLPHGGDTGMSLRGKDAPHRPDADAVPLLPHAVADLPLLFLLPDEGLLHHLPAVGPHPPDDTLPPSSVGTVPHLFHHRRGGCPTLPQNAPQDPSDAPPDLLSAEVPLLRGGTLLHPPPPSDIGGVLCCPLPSPAGIPDPPIPLPTAAPCPLQTAVALFVVPSVLRAVSTPPAHHPLISGDSSRLPTVANPSAGCPAPQSPATTREHLQALSL